MGKRFALGALIIVALTSAAVATAGLLEIDEDVGIIASGQKIPHIKGVLDEVDAGDPQTILILGSDRRYIDKIQGNPARSDTILLVRLDPSKPATTVLSIPRDLEVDIPGYGRAKINEAYSDGGPRKTVETIRSLFHFPINHVVNVNFGGFRRAVDRLGCVYVDIDRRYFNDNNPPVGGGGNYATIDVQPGYQRLCGADALDYVRFRHLDTDFVRASRQQDFLRQAKDQIGIGRLFGSRKELLRIFARYTQTDIRDTVATLRLLKLAFEAAQNPVREVPFRGYDAGDTSFSYVAITQEDLIRTRNAFLYPKPLNDKKEGSTKPRRPTTPKHGLAPGVLADWAGAQANIASARGRAGFPVYYAGHRLTAARYADQTPRVYDLYDRSHKRYRAYRVVFDQGGIGQYYGIQGTSWLTPPLLAHPSETRTIDGRRFELFYDGRHLRLVAFRTKRGVYWVANTLSKTLTNRQMLDIAGSLRRARRGG